MFFVHSLFLFLVLHIFIFNVERLEQLFIARRKWSREELLPYIFDLADDSKKLDLLLLKYARLSRVRDVLFYSKR